ncbi:GMC oxidoreductase [Stachybotrys elegans]|uniref:GMC oxidoreductase n=1 Tax=Stachybotrys elegans TaxID=80388 RepID=A0A8K0WM42_9HYPO|nr:GMC oxidoreductase [Stachybotrys elegans]
MTPSITAGLAFLAASFSVGLARSVSRSDLRASYDYVIVGGGASGLTVANRLSEDADVTVLVIEAGPFDEGEDFITIPGLGGGGFGSRYDWNISLARNDLLGIPVQACPQGKAVGGTTVINLMAFDRGSRSDYDRWERLGLPGWNWETLLKYFKKAKTISPPQPDIAKEYNITVDHSVHGFKGYIQSTYAPFYWPTTRNIVDAFLELGIHIPADSGNGDAYGGYFTPQNRHPVTAARVSARDAYYETARDRPNFHILTDTLVTRLLTKGKSGSISISGVEVSSLRCLRTGTVTADKEVILAGGAIRTPQLLQVSGIGDPALLERFDIPVVVDLPAVGHNFHDHLHVPLLVDHNASLVPSNLTTNATYAAESRELYDRERAGPYTSVGADFLGFLPLRTISNSSTTSALQQAAAAQDVTEFLGDNTPAAVVRGYKAMYKVLTERLPAPDSAVIELISADRQLVVSLQQPYSRGSVRINSSSMEDTPIADSRVLHNPLDVEILVEGIRWARTLIETEALAELQTREVLPGANVTSDRDLAAFVLEAGRSAYHLAGSCTMGPKERGGVVDAQLKVYGVTNLRIVDASVMPLLPASHPQATVFGVAEMAADIIRGRI